MAISLSNNSAATAADAVLSPATGGFLVLYSGAVPADADTLIANTILVSIPLDSVDAFQTAVDADPGARATVTPVPAATITETGTASFFRIVNSTGTLTLLQGTVSGPAGGGDLELSDPALLQADTVTIDGLTITFPES